MTTQTPEPGEPGDIGPDPFPITPAPDPERPDDPPFAEPHIDPAQIEAGTPPDPVVTVQF